MKENNNKFTYTTQDTQSRAELRKHLQAILKELIQQDFVNQNTGLIATLTSDDVNKISSREASKKSESNNFTKEEHFKVAEDIGNLYENATLKETHADRKKSPNIANVHRFNIDVEVNNKDTQVKITMFERFEGKNRIYTLELQQLDPLLDTSCVKEAEVAKLLSCDEEAPHDDPSIYCNSDDETIPQDSSDCQTQGNLDLADSNNESTQTTRKRMEKWKIV